MKDRSMITNDPTKSLSVDKTATVSSGVKWAALIVVVIVGVGLVLALAEGAVRVRQWHNTGAFVSMASMYKVDKSINLRVLTPGFRSDRISINSLGFRGPEIAPIKPKNVMRVAFLGASTTFCAEASGDAAVWPQIVTDLLRRRFANTAFDFVNGGVPGYTVESSRKNLKYRIAPLTPDLIVVYHATNDLSGEVRQRAELAHSAGAADSGHESWLERHSLFWELVVKNLRVREAQSEVGSGNAHHLQVDAGTLGQDFERDLTSLVRESAAVASRVAVVTFSTQLRADQSLAAQKKAAVSAFVYMPFMSIDGLLAGYGRYNNIIKQVATSEHALLITGEDDIPGDPAHFVDTVHFTDSGNRAMAERVFSALVRDPKVLELIQARSGK